MKILDRYLLAELSAPLLFGLSAFTLIFAATEILNIGKLVSSEHAPLWAAIESFLWSLPWIVVLVIPMALLLGVLLAIQRLSSSSEIIAMKASGITLVRIVAPLLAAGFVASLITLALQEWVVPFAQDRKTYLIEEVIKGVNPFAKTFTATLPLPDGGRQVTFASAYEPTSATALNVTLIQYSRDNRPRQLIFSDRAQFNANQWNLENASTYRFNPDGTIFVEPQAARTRVDIGEKPAELVKRARHDDPEQMSRAELADVVRSGQLSPPEERKYIATYQEKLARPFACFVFTLIAIPFGLRTLRGGGTGLGFGLAVAIVFTYFVVASIFSSLGSAYSNLAFVEAWMPNVLFTAFGVARLRKAAAI